MRGRVSAGMLRMMGMPETIAGTIDDYVALAVRIARDPAWRAELKRAYRERQAAALSRSHPHCRARRFPRPRRRGPGRAT